VSLKHLQDAQRYAAELDGTVQHARDGLRLDFDDLVRGLRKLLQDSEQSETSNNVFKLLRQSRKSGAITLGPANDCEATSEHFLFDRGSRLSFALTLRQVQGAWALVAFVFDLHFADGHQPAFLRFCPRGETHEDPVREPLLHLHPGNDHMRVPCGFLHPQLILSWILHSQR
jgi:hypothetical protein